MAIRSESRWWIVALVLLAAIFGLAWLALDRPDVVWSAGAPQCPQCRAEVRPFSSRCTACREEFDWTVAPDADSPISSWSLSPLEEDQLRGRVKVLGEAAAVARIESALRVTPEAAALYLRQLASGRCGWCGGTGSDPAVAAGVADAPCPACFGGRACVACGGDRRIRVGDEGAARALVRYQESLKAIRPTLDLEVQRAEVRRLGEAFLKAHVGVREAQDVAFAPFWGDTARGANGKSVVQACRDRLDLVLRTLTAP